MKKNGQIFIGFAIVLFFLATTACSEKSEKNQNNETVEDSTMNLEIIADQEPDSIPTISGSCANGREIGELNRYVHKLKIGTSPTDSISVRSDAACFEIAACHENILGKIKSGTIVYAEGPLKNRGGSAGIAYAFPVKDQEGNICRGYLSYLNVEPADTNTMMYQSPLFKK